MTGWPPAAQARDSAESCWRNSGRRLQWATVPGVRGGLSPSLAPRPRDGPASGQAGAANPVPAHLPSLAEEAGGKRRQSSSAVSSSGDRLTGPVTAPGAPRGKPFTVFHARPFQRAHSCPTGKQHSLFPSGMELPLGIAGSLLGLPSRVLAVAGFQAWGCLCALVFQKQ